MVLTGVFSRAFQFKFSGDEKAKTDCCWWFFMSKCESTLKNLQVLSMFIFNPTPYRSV